MRRKKKSRRKPSKTTKIMAKRAKWMRNGSATIHEQIVRDILQDICNTEGLTLKNQKIFYVQFANKWYITDFWIKELKLIIEIDGSSHNDKTAIYDQTRTDRLELIGNKVVRFTNNEVETRHFKEKLYSCVKRYSEALPLKNKIRSIK